MFCKNCGAKLIEGARFCKLCGTRADYIETVAQNYETEAQTQESQASAMQQNAAQTQESQASAIQQTAVQTQEQPPIQKKNGRKLIVAVCIALLVLAAAFGGFYIYASSRLDSLRESREAFAVFTEEKGLSKVESYSELIEESEAMNSIFDAFNVTDMQDKLTVATEECEELYDELQTLKKRIPNTAESIERYRLSGEQKSEHLRLDEEAEKQLEAGDLEGLEDTADKYVTLLQEIQEDNTDYVEQLLETYYNADRYVLSDEINSKLDQTYNNINITLASGEYAEACTLAEDLANDVNQAMSEYYQAEEDARQARLAEEEARLAEEEARRQALIDDGLPQNTVTICTIGNEMSGAHPDRYELYVQTGVDVEMNYVEFMDMKDKITLEVAAGMQSDIYNIPYYLYPQLAANGYIADITDEWERLIREGTDEAFAKAQEPLYIDGRIYGITVTLPTAPVMYVRKSLLDNYNLRLPTTLEEFEALLEALRSGMNYDNTSGDQVFGMLYNYQNAIDMLYPYTQSKLQGLYVDREGNLVDGFAVQETYDALLEFKRIYDKGLIHCPYESDYDSAFFDGRCGVYMYYAGYEDYIEERLAQSGIYDDVIMIPPFTDSKKLSGSYNYVYVFTNEENIRGAIKYVIEPMLDGGAVQTNWIYGESDIDYITEYNMNQYFTPVSALTGIEEYYTSSLAEVSMVNRNFVEEYVETKPAVNYAVYNADSMLDSLRMTLILDIMREGKAVDEAWEDYLNSVEEIWPDVESEYYVYR